MHENRGIQAATELVAIAIYGVIGAVVVVATGGRGPLDEGVWNGDGRASVEIRGKPPDLENRGLVTTNTLQNLEIALPSE